MKKNIFTATFVILFAVLLTSCSALHQGYMANSASLSSANFSYVRNNIKGESTATYILGIGGLAKETLVNDAKQRMLTDNPLKNNQALANLTVNFKTSAYFIFYTTCTCTVTADVVEFK
jgi:hypothetical protein